VSNEIRVKNVFLRSEAPKKKSYSRDIMAHRLVFNNFFVPQQKQPRKFGGYVTLPETNSNFAPENGPLKPQKGNESSEPTINFQVLC